MNQYVQLEFPSVTTTIELACRNCLIDPPLRSQQQFEEAGWTDIERYVPHDGFDEPWWTHLGLCPACRKQRDVR